VTHGAWIVFERSGRWAAALRMQLACPQVSATVRARLYEVRNTPELGERLEDWPNSVALVEVSRRNIAEVLDWLAAAHGEFPRTRFVALVDTQSFNNQLTTESSPSDRQLVVDALWEAGAAEIVHSLRRMRHIVEFGRRHFENCAQIAPQDAENQSIADWAWASLPWQDG
jgi:hypothetical protein